MPKKKQMEEKPELLDITEEAVPFLETLKNAISTTTTSLEITYKNHKTELTDTVNPADRYIMLNTYHKTMYIQHGLSGDVKFFQFKTPIFKQDNPQNIVFLTAVINRTHTAYAKNLTVNLKGLYYTLYNVDHGSSPYSGKILILYCVARSMGEMFPLIKGVEDEEEILKRVVAAARISKMASKVLVPVMDLNGNVIDAKPVDNEELIFVHVLTHLLAELRRRRIEGSSGVA